MQQQQQHQKQQEQQQQQRLQERETGQCPVRKCFKIVANPLSSSSSPHHP